MANGLAVRKLQVDIIAVVALLLGPLLGQNLASVAILLMVTGGEMLEGMLNAGLRHCTDEWCEGYATRRAGATLDAMLKVMPRSARCPITLQHSTDSNAAPDPPQGASPKGLTTNP